MYHLHFSLREPPFSLTPDTAYFFAHPSAQAALNTLLVALRSGEGFVKIVGEVGCGKTLLCRRLLAALSKDCETAYIPNPSLDSRTMLLAVCEELGIRVDATATGHRVVKELERALLERARAGRRVVLVIDEAQAIPDRTVELLRLVSNIETEKRKLLQIVLFGQPELDARLAQPHLRQLLQRISFSERIHPLGEEEVGEYVRHRLAVAGAGDARVFDDRALAELSRRSGGVPRLINVIAHKAMMLAFGEGATTVAGRHVAMASDDTPGLGASARLRWFGWMFAGAGRSRS
ncbi:MAG TPA: AAA family ATPase [Usitatibacter sp.]|nr:AAA family ATPase [Usitatibacter sp.]